jgi:hypothetical protein
MKKILMLLFLVFSINLFADEISDLKQEISKLKEEVEMNKLMLDDLMGSGESSGPKASFRINGFIEFRYEDMTWESNNKKSEAPLTYGAWSYADPGQFGVKNLNMYFDFSYGNKIRAFSEIKFLNNPTGVEEFMYDDRTVANDGNGSFISFGSTYIERAWIDYKVNDSFKVKAGKFFTPYGIWNVEHGAPILPSIKVPITIAYGILPNRQVGINFHGDRLIGDWEFGYNAYVSNGRGDWTIENNINKAFGMNFNFKVPTKYLKSLAFGFGVYSGKEILKANQNYLKKVNMADGSSEYLVFSKEVENEVREKSFAAHFAAAWKKIELNAEYIYNKLKYDDLTGINNLNYRLFYRPDNKKFIDGTVANSSVQALSGGLKLLGADSSTTTTISDYVTFLDGQITGATAIYGAGSDTVINLMTVRGGLLTIQSKYQADTVGEVVGMTTVEGVASVLNTEYGNACPLLDKSITRKGFYALLQYHLTTNITPYFLYELTDPGENDAFQKVQVTAIGINYKPLPVVTLKMEYSMQRFKDEESLMYDNDTVILDGKDRKEDFNYFQTSVSYAF